MNWLAHLAAGLIIGKFTGNYWAAISVSILIDLDHLIGLVRHKIIFNPKRFWRIHNDYTHPLNNQRHFMHSIFSLIILTGIVAFFDPKSGLAVFLAYTVHLLMDLVNGGENRIFYPFKFKLKRSIPYMSKKEILFTMMLLTFFWLL